MESIYIVAILAALVVLSFVIFGKSLKPIFKILINTALGFVALIIVNQIGAYIGVNIGINTLNAVIVGIFGLPGVALLLLLQWLMVL